MANTQYPTIEELTWKPHVQLEPLEKMYILAMDALSEYTGVEREKVHLHIIKVSEWKDKENAVD